MRKTSSQQAARLNACRPMNKAGMTSASYPFPSPSHTSETATGPKVYGNPPPLKPVTIMDLLRFRDPFFGITLQRGTADRPKV
ncbi:MAG: hypothetical protein EOO38_12430 [Cytophagaceae bacterium]|nr:MAG: hypothetical protein EOO38_12430 [Cytophagaceae bacterium]